jgi:hypothetical protein
MMCSRFADQQPKPKTGNSREVMILYLVLLQTMTLRRRQRVEKNENHHDDEIDSTNMTLLDEDDQEILIQQLRIEYRQQSDRLDYIFTILCRFIVPSLSLLYTVILEYQESNQTNTKTQRSSPNQLITLRWIHLVLNILIHWNIPRGMFRRSILAQESTTNTKTTTPGSGNIASNSIILWYGVYLPYFLTLFITAMAYWMIRQQQLPQVHYTASAEILYSYFHVTLCISASIFILSALYIKCDHHDYVYNSINELQSYKYEYKSL